MAHTVRVGTYNLYLGADLSLVFGDRTDAELTAGSDEVQRQLLATAFPSRAPTIAKLLVRERLDLVGLQEVCRWEAGGELVWDFANELLAALEAVGDPYELVVTQPTFTGAGAVLVGGRSLTMRVEGSNAILRRRGSEVRVESTATGTYASALAVSAMGVGLSIGRGWCSARCTLHGTPFDFVDTHTEAYDELPRNQQRDELLGVLSAGEEPVALVGDFNATPDRVGMPEAWVDAWIAAGHPSTTVEAATCGQAPDLANEESELVDRIDYVWVRGTQVLSSRRFGADPEDRTPEGLWPSDHAGVAAELSLSANRQDWPAEKSERPTSPEVVPDVH